MGVTENSEGTETLRDDELAKKKPGEAGTDDNPSNDKLADVGEAPVPAGEEDDEERGDEGDAPTDGEGDFELDVERHADDGGDDDRDEERAREELRKKPPQRDEEAERPMP
jgi:hypothetical protein